MAYGKRKRYSANYVNNQPAYRKRYGSSKPPAKRRRTSGGAVSRALAGVKRLNNMIECKEGCYITNVGTGYNHNTISIISNGATGNNIFARNNGTSDPMNGNALVMIGDQINVKGVKARFFIENSLQRSKVYYRIMFLKGPRGATFTDCYKGITGNKIIDQINTEKYKIIAQKMFTVTPSNAVAQSVGLTGTGIIESASSSLVLGGQATKVVNFWIPGSKISKNGLLRYENNSSDVKFYDYRWVICVYDWYGTPAGNTVGQINEGYFKIYFKDA